jgi:hypothetical protein
MAKDKTQKLTSEPTKITAKYARTDDQGNKLKDEDGKQLYAQVDASYNFGANLAEAIERCGGGAEGESIVFEQHVAQTKVDVQSVMRRLDQQGMAPDAIQRFLDNWRPGVTTPSKPADPVATVAAAAATSTPEELKALKAKIDALLAG